MTTSTFQRSLIKRLTNQLRTTNPSSSLPKKPDILLCQLLLNYVLSPRGRTCWKSIQIQTDESAVVITLSEPKQDGLLATPLQRVRVTICKQSHRITALSPQVIHSPWECVISLPPMMVVI